MVKRAILLFIAFLLSGCFPDYDHYTWPEALTTHEVTQVHQAEVAWQLSDVIVEDSESIVAAFDGYVFFLGRLGRDAEDGIFALDAEDGSLFR